MNGFLQLSYLKHVSWVLPQGYIDPYKPTGKTPKGSEAVVTLVQDVLLWGTYVGGAVAILYIIVYGVQVLKGTRRTEDMKTPVIFLLVFSGFWAILELMTGVFNSLI